MEGQGDASLTGPLPHPAGGFLSHMDPFAALVFIAVQPQAGDPFRGLHRGAVCLGKAVGIARRAKFGAHRKGLLLPSIRKGVSAA